MVEQLKKTKHNIVKGESGLFWQFFLTVLKIHKIHKTLKCQRNNTSPVHLKNPKTSFFFSYPWPNILLYVIKISIIWISRWACGWNWTIKMKQSLIAPVRMQVPTDFFQSFFINSINAEKVATGGACWTINKNKVYHCQEQGRGCLTLVLFLIL